MTDEQVYTKETLPGLYNSLMTHADTLKDQIKSNEKQRENCDKNLIGLNTDLEVLEKRIGVLDHFAAKAHIMIKPILQDTKQNPQAKAEDNMKVMLKKLVKEILVEVEAEEIETLKELDRKIPAGVNPETFASLPEVYDKVKYLITQMKEGQYHEIHQAYETLDQMAYVQLAVESSISELANENYFSDVDNGPEEPPTFKLVQ